MEVKRRTLTRTRKEVTTNTETGGTLAATVGQLTLPVVATRTRQLKVKVKVEPLNATGVEAGAISAATAPAPIQGQAKDREEVKEDTEDRKVTKEEANDIR